MDVTVDSHRTLSTFHGFAPRSIIMDRYTVHQRLGSGSFATAYLVTDAKDTGHQKVLKRIPCEGLRPDATLPSAREAKLLGSLKHPFIVRFFSSFLEKEDFCIITEFCEGGDLQNRIQQQREKRQLFPEEHVMEWFIQLLLGVNYLHERLILHRDLKTKNVFLKNGTVKIGDFGVSRILSMPSDMATTFTGTPHYMSPEVHAHYGYNAKSDIWSLGCILYEICALRHAFDSPNWIKLVSQIVEGPCPSLPKQYSAELNDILKRVLNKDPQQRPSASEILHMPSVVDHEKVLSLWLQEALHEGRQDSGIEDAARIAAEMQEKLHLDSLRVMRQVQDMAPRQRRRIRKEEQQETYMKKIKRAADRIYKEKHQRFGQSRRSELNEDKDQRPADTMHVLEGNSKDSYSDSEEESSGEIEDESLSSVLTMSMPLSEEQSSTLSAYQSCLQRFLDSSTNGYGVGTSGTFTSDASMFSCDEEELARLKLVCVQCLGEEGFLKVYEYLKQVYNQQDSDYEENTLIEPQEIQLYPEHCQQVQQLLFLEERMKQKSFQFSWL
ncbi:serine/threonine-protein kinase Nek11 [Xenopus laevis]|uniref:non-specific serine/threonine protein kinase n=1 Tax=Xenopus laevis TaxID=8355 RepID=A0A8J0U4T4_XENLA|nr:serine/threonine-protein kinase Nek11 [Xenopus laevis]OCT57370.1 hypothetical protein XELAEV_18003570mg [Xenopus laevis]